MKTTYKLLMTSVVVLVVLILFNTNIFAYNITYNAWRYDVDGDNKLDLLFRRYSTPTEEALKDYYKADMDNALGDEYTYQYNGKGYPSKWVYVENTGIHKPSEKEFATVGYTFNKKAYVSYENSSSVNWGYGAMYTNQATTNTLGNIRNYFNNLTSIYVEGFNLNILNETLYEYYGVAPLLSNQETDSRPTMTAIIPKENMVYRYAIVNVEGYGNVYVEDRVIYNEHVSALREKLGDEDTCYISDIIISKALPERSGYEISKNISAFLNQHGKKNYSYRRDSYDIKSFYPEDILGLDSVSRSTRSVFNVFDNIINLPQKSKKKVLVRHINLGNENILSEETFEKSTRYCDDTNYNAKECTPYLTVTNVEEEPLNVYASKQNKAYIRKVSGIKVEEAYIYDDEKGNDIEIYHDIEKHALENKICLGYNMSINSSLQEAMETMDSKIKNGVYTEGTIVTLDGLPAESDTEYVVIDFYYTETPEVLHVNHIYVDKDNTVQPITTEKIMLKPADYALTGEAYDIQIPRLIGEYNSLGSNPNIVVGTAVKYVRAKNQSLLVRTASSLRNNEDIECVGYVMYKTEREHKDLAGYTVSPQTNWYDIEASWKGVVVPGNVKQINFYYYKKDKLEAQVPNKQIPLEYKISTCKEGEICVDACYNGTCKNNEGNEIYSIPSGMNTYVGLTSLYRAVASAITLDYVRPEENTQTLKLNLSYNFGDEKITTTIDNIKYSFGYYIVSKLAVEALDSGVVYDASSKWENTTGTRIFDWKNNFGNYIDKQEFDLSPELDIKLTGAKEIANNNSEIKNWKNYINIEVTDKNYASAKGTDTINLSSTYLSKSKLKEVDANGDGKIIGCDKLYATDCNVADCDIHFAATKLNQYEKEYNDVQIQLKNLEKDIADVEAKRAAMNEAKSSMESAKEKYDEQKAVVDAKKEELDQKAAQIPEGESLPTVIAKETLQEEKRNLQSTINSNLSMIEQLEFDNEMAQDHIDLFEYYTEGLKNIDKCTDDSESCKVQEIRDLYATQEYKDIKVAYTAAEAEYNEAETRYNSNGCDFCLSSMGQSRCNDSIILACGLYKENLQEAQQKRDEAEEALEQKEIQIANKKSKWKNEADKFIKTNENFVADWKQAVIEGEKDIAELNAKIEELKENISVIDIKLEYIEILKKHQSEIEKMYREKKLYDEATINYELAKGEYIELSALISRIQQIKEAATKKKEQYENYKEYNNDLKSHYYSYKRKYSEFIELKNIIAEGNEQKIVDYLNIRVTFNVYNMKLELNVDKGNPNSKYHMLNNSSNNSTKKTMNLSDVMENAPEIIAPNLVFNADIYKSIGEQYEYSKKAHIDSEKLNGIRTLAAEVQYTSKVLIGGDISPRTIEDNVYYSDNISDARQKEIKDAVFKLNYDNRIVSATKQVNVYTPIFVNATLTSSGLVDQSANNISDNVQAIQLATPFTITLDNKVSIEDSAYGINDTGRFCRGYYIKFDYDIHQVYINGKLYNDGKRVKAGTWIGIIEKNSSGAATITATAYSEVQDDTINIADDERSSYTVRAVAYNTTYDLEAEQLRYLDLLEMLNDRSAVKHTLENICTNTSTTQASKNIPSYVTEKVYDVVILNRVYDFRVTDLQDLSWKNVFREPVNDKINSHTGTVYYSGIRKWQVSNTTNNSMVRRTVSEIGNNPVRILPLGAYKNTDLTYIKAPKLGYRFSFDLKVTGQYYNKAGNIMEDKNVKINTKFFFVSDDGKTFLTEGNGGIILLYKNSAGQYVKIDEQGGNYGLSFVPNDGYRLFTTKEIIPLSKDKLELGNLRSITLTHDMATVAEMYNTGVVYNNGWAITYYGEYKLPNSTIAVQVDENGKFDINKPLKNGYIGVVFDIQAQTGKDQNGNPVTLHYSDDTNGNNTSQWDYEGFLGMSTPGEDANVSLKLEGGKWKLTEEQYDAIKGTVILYDADERAANDFE